MAESISTKLNDTEVYLVGPIGPTLKSLLNQKILVPRLIEKDEVHLILEYAADEIFEQTRSPIANRFIVSHDIYNSEMKMLDEFFEVINKYQPDLIILSGLHLLESQSQAVRINKLQSLKRHLVQNSELKNVIHLELASIGDQALMREILEINFFHDFNSIGLNEQELLYLAYTSVEAPHYEYFNQLNGQPEIAKVTDILDWILNKYGKSAANPTSRLTRIHFHCLAYHVIAVKVCALIV
jgi:ADP-dependent glucokinase